MLRIIILLFTLSAFLIYEHVVQTISLPSLSSSAQAQESSFENNIDLTGTWKRDDGQEIYITQTDSEVIAKYPDTGPCKGLENSEHDLQFQGKIEGKQVKGEQSAWCYYDSPNPEENGLFFDRFEATISDDG